jgi:hypothetical protein
MDEREIKIRALTNDDSDKIAELIVKLGQSEDMKSVLEMIIPACETIQKTDDPSEQVNSVLPLAEKLLGALRVRYKTELRALFADLAGVKPEDYGKLPFGADFIIISQMLESKEFADFFSGASLAFKWIKEYGKKLLKGKMK